MLGVFGDKAQNRKDATAAVQSVKDMAYIGRTDFRGTNRLFGIQRRDRRQHMYVIGKTGTGKSVLLHNLILQDIMHGDGVCVVDPHGELIESLLVKIPKSRAEDVIYFNPADTDYPLGFNVLELPDPKYKHLVASGLMGIFTKIWSNVWSARMEYIMNNAVLALLDTPHTTLLGIPRLLVDKEYRQKIIANLKDPVVRAFWVNEYEEWQDKFRSEAIAPIQNKVGQFLSTAIVRNVVGQSKSTFDVFSLMNQQKIFLVNVSKGRIGEDNAALLGAMIITKIQLASMERVRIPEDERKDFYLYVDEFQNFATDSFAGILSEARKYRLDLTIAHQYVGQLTTDVSTVVRDAVFGNVGTMISFRVGATDAEFLEKEFEPEFMIQDIINLPNYHIYLKMMVNGVTSRPFSARTLAPFNINEEAAGMNAVIEMSRKRYALPKEQVEKDINRWSGVMPADQEAEIEEAAEAAIKEGGAIMGKDGKTLLYSAKCSNCGTETKVPFKPMPGRPIYCSECLDKIKAGELQPISPREIKQKEYKQEQSMRSLAELGIEFEMPSRSEERAMPRQDAAPVRPVGEPKGRLEPRGDIRRGDGRPRFSRELPKSNDGFISLKDLKPGEKEPPKPEVIKTASSNIEGLKDLIKKALGMKEE